VINEKEDDSNIGLGSKFSIVDKNPVQIIKLEKYEELYIEYLQILSILPCK